MTYDDGAMTWDNGAMTYDDGAMTHDDGATTYDDCAMAHLCVQAPFVFEYHALRASELSTPRLNFIGILVHSASILPV